jgi:3-oxoacyl-[acyl-carrier protein] reductase
MQTKSTGVADTDLNQPLHSSEANDATGMQVDLRNKIVLVTGAARGIGKATASLMARNGATVVIADIDAEEAKRTAGEFPRAEAMRMDVANENEVAEAMEWMRSHYGSIDILVNNAGVNTINHRVTIAELPTAEWDRIINIDLRGLFLVSRAACALMSATGTGRIINISSVLGLVPAREQSAFIAAKAAVINLTRSMAIELAPRGILVNCVAPGSTLTETTGKLFYGSDAVMKDKAKRLMAHVPLGRVGTADEIANAILFFAAPSSSYVTGQVLAVDGGWSAGGFLRDF